MDCDKNGLDQTKSELLPGADVRKTGCNGDPVPTQKIIPQLGDAPNLDNNDNLIQGEARGPLAANFPEMIATRTQLTRAKSETFSPALDVQKPAANHSASVNLPEATKTSKKTEAGVARRTTTAGG